MNLNSLPEVFLPKYHCIIMKLFQYELERKYCELEQKFKMLDKEVMESHSLTASLSESVHETERLCVEKTRCS